MADEREPTGLPEMGDAPAEAPGPAIVGREPGEPLVWRSMDLPGMDGDSEPD